MLREPVTAGARTADPTVAHPTPHWDGPQGTLPAVGTRTAPVRQVVELACRAPSVHNTQPWRWRATPSGLELYADRGRQLRHTDPDGRVLTLSCGAALHHAQVAAEGLGWQAVVDRCPDPARPDLLATLSVHPTPVTPDAEALLAALRVRTTDRRRFTSWPLPAERFERWAREAAAWGAMVVPLTEPQEKREVAGLLRRAAEVERGEPYASEAATWVGGTGGDGIPRTSIPEPHPARPVMPSRYRDGDLADPLLEPFAEVQDGPDDGLGDGFGDGFGEEVDGLALLCTGEDDPVSWLRAGETLSALWLSMVRNGLSLLPLSQVTEVPETRDALRGGLLAGMASPQLLVRVGWQELTRRPLPATPRRAVEEVLELA